MQVSVLSENLKEIMRGVRLHLPGSQTFGCQKSLLGIQRPSSQTLECMFLETLRKCLRHS